MNKFIVAVFPLILLISCHNQGEYNYLDITVLDSIVIEVPFQYKGSPFAFDVYSKGDKLIAQLQDNEFSTFYELDLTNRKFIESINLAGLVKKEHVLPVFFTKRINADSIILVQTPFLFGANHDSVFKVVNNSGELFGTIPVPDGNYGGTYFKNTGSSKRSINHMYISFEQLEMNGNALYTLTKRRESIDCKDQLGNELYPLGAQMKIENGEVKFQQHYINISSSDENFCRIDNWRQLFISESEVLYLNNYSSNIILYHSDRMEQKVILNDYPYLFQLQSEKENLVFVPSFAQGFRTDDGFIRFGYFGGIHGMSQNDYNSFKYNNVWLGFYDKELNLKAEAKGDSRVNWIYPKPVMHNNEIYALKKSDTPSNKVVIYKLAYNIIPKPKDFYLSVIPSENAFPVTQTQSIVEYLVEINKDSCRFLLFIPNNSCASCVNYVLSEYLSNLEYYKRKNLHLVLERNLINNIQKDYNIDNFDLRRFIFIEERKDHFEKLDYDFGGNPSVVMLKEGKICKRLVLNPNELMLLKNFEKHLK